mgnify:CR=1 FL=1
MNNRLPIAPCHPGEILKSEFLDPMGISQSEFASHLRVSFKRINEIINKRRAISPETAWLLSEALGTTPQFWMNLQIAYDLVHNPADYHVKTLPSVG